MVCGFGNYKGFVNKMRIETLLEYREREPLIGGDPKEVLPPYKIKDIRVAIRKGAKDLTQDWKNPIELVNKAYDVCGCKVPKPSMVDGWKDYKDMLELCIQTLAKTRGPYAKWRLSLPPADPADVAPSE